MIVEISYEIRSAGDLVMDKADTLKEAIKIRDLYVGNTKRKYFIYRVTKEQAKYDTGAGQVINKKTGKHLDKTFVDSAKQKTCGTCKDWNFKCSNVKAWGQCLNPKKRNFCYVSMRGFPDHLKNTDEYHQFQKDVKYCCEVYFEENFGCINHQKG